VLDGRGSAGSSRTPARLRPAHERSEHYRLVGASQRHRATGRPHPSRRQRAPDAPVSMTGGESV